MNIPIANDQPVKLDQAALTWFNDRKNQYMALPKPQPATPITAAVDALLSKDPRDLVMQDLFSLDDWVLTLLSKDSLASRLKSLRDEYKEVFGKEAWEAIQPTLLPQVDPAKEEENRAEARRLQEELHWQSSIFPWASRMRTWMMLAVLIVLVLAVLFLYLVHNWHRTELMVPVVVMGVIGGAVSTIQRIQAANLASSQALLLARYSRVLGVIISPVLGGMFALVMALFLLSKTVTPGSVVPDVAVTSLTNRPPASSASANPGEANRERAKDAGASATAQPTGTNDIGANSAAPRAKANDPASVSRGSGPESPVDSGRADKFFANGLGKFTFFSLPVLFPASKDLALFLLWAFVAGFSERLVPDLLSKLAESGRA